MTKNKLIRSISELKRLTSTIGREGFILLNGNARSSKAVHYDGKKFIVFNFIDDTTQELTEKQLYTRSNIGEAIDKKAFYLYNS